MEFLKVIAIIRPDYLEKVEQALGIAEAIMEAAYTGLPGDGIVAIQPVETVFHIQSRSAFRIAEEG